MRGGAAEDVVAFLEESQSLGFIPLEQLLEGRQKRDRGGLREQQEIVPKRLHDPRVAWPG